MTEEETNNALEDAYMKGYIAGHKQGMMQAENSMFFDGHKQGFERGYKEAQKLNTKPKTA